MGDNITENSGFVNRREKQDWEKQGTKRKFGKIFEVGKKEKSVEQGIVGKAIIPERKKEIEQNDEDSERERVRRKTRRRKILSIARVLILIGVLGGLTVVGVENFLKILSNREEREIEDEKYVPTIEIYDENTGKSSNNDMAEISLRMIEYVGQIEADLKDLGYKVSRAVLPIGKAREVDIYIEGKSMYFKVNIDRETAMTAEDIGRMTKYLEANGINPEYIDVRVEGKAYYK